MTLGSPLPLVLGIRSGVCGLPQTFTFPGIEVFANVFHWNDPVGELDKVSSGLSDGSRNPTCLMGIVVAGLLLSETHACSWCVAYRLESLIQPAMVQLPPVTIDNDLSAYYTKMPSSPTGSWKWYSSLTTPRTPRGGNVSATTPRTLEEDSAFKVEGVDRVSLAEDSPVRPSSPVGGHDPRCDTYMVEGIHGVGGGGRV